MRKMCYNRPRKYPIGNERKDMPETVSGLHTMKNRYFRQHLLCLITVLLLLSTLLSGCGRGGSGFETATNTPTVTTPTSGQEGTPTPEVKPERFPGRANADTKTGAKKELAKGDVAPDFTVTLLDGTSFKMSDHDDETVLLNFWATWCGPCVNEMPGLQQLKDDGIEGFTVLCLSIDDTKAEVEQFRKESSYSTSLLGSAKGTAIPDYYPSDYIPYTVLVKGGIVQEIFVGSRPYKDYRSAVDTVMSGQ